MTHFTVEYSFSVQKPLNKSNNIQDNIILWGARPKFTLQNTGTQGG